MINPNDIKEQLMAILPQFTDEYGDETTGAALVSGGVIEIVAPTHELSDNDVITVSEATVDISVTGVSYNTTTGEATITLSEDHDRTSGVLDNGGYNQVILSGFADANYNGTFTAISATENTVNISADADVVGALGIFTEIRGMYYGFSVVTVIDADTFSIPVVDGLANGLSFNSLKFCKELRIYIAADVTRAATKWHQKADRKPTLFIVPGNETASKDRNTMSDAVLAVGAQNSGKMRYVMEFTLLTVAATPTEQLAATQLHKVYEEIRPALRQSLFGKIFDQGETLQQYSCVEVNNTPLEWNQNNYAHTFVYQLPYDITLEQGFIHRRSVSFRRIILNSTIFNNEGDEIIADASLEI